MAGCTRMEFASRLRSRIGNEDWSRLAGGSPDIDVNDFNRATLLRLRGFHADDDAPVDEEAAARLEAMLADYLAEYMSDRPQAHLPIVLSCLALAFVFREPMHPVDVVGARVRVSDGAAAYYCPQHTGSETLCAYCACHPISELESLEREMVEGTAAAHGERSAKIQRALLDAGMLESGVVLTDRLALHEEVRRACEANTCGSYGSCWACPPAVGTLGECRERCLRYERLQVFSRAYLLEDAFDFEGMADALADFKQRVIAVAPAIRAEAKSPLILSNEGCGLCARCTWPDAPCRFPDRCFHSIEGYGFVVSELARDAGIAYNNGPGTVTFLGGVLYNG